MSGRAGKAEGGTVTDRTITDGPVTGGGAGRQVTLDRITVALIPKSAEDLQALQERTSLSKTDLVNRAITLYEFIDARIRAGRDVLIRDTQTGETQTVIIL